MKLGVNIDHIAVLREARRVNDPDIMDALSIVKRSGAEQITIHLREDRRHIQDSDAINICRLSPLPINLESAIAPDVIDLIIKIKPHRVTLVPEKRQEVTTEGGLDIVSNFDELKKVIDKLHAHEIEVSLFIDPVEEILQTAKELEVEWLEFHTGKYANIYAMLNSNLRASHHTIQSLELPRKALNEMLKYELKNLELVALNAKNMGFCIAAGHGLNYHNVKDIVKIEAIEELNIGQSIIARSIFVGLQNAISEMRELLK
jgi:pyridoxine 5-phosphate synthase